MSFIMKEIVLLCVLSTSLWFATLFAQECVPIAGYEGCACKMNVSNTTKVINLLPLKDNSTEPRFTFSDPKKWKYSYDPCSEFSMFVGENRTGYKPCINVSVARWSKQSTHVCDSLGNQESAKFKTYEENLPTNVSSNITLSFMDSTSKYTAVISLVCNMTVLRNESMFKFIGENDKKHNTYYFSLTSKCACPGLCGIPPEKEKPADKKGGKQKGSDDKPLKTWQIVVIAVGGFLVLVLLVAIFVCCARKRGYQRI